MPVPDKDKAKVKKKEKFDPLTIGKSKRTYDAMDVDLDADDTQVLDWTVSEEKEIKEGPAKKRGHHAYKEILKIGLEHEKMGALPGMHHVKSSHIKDTLVDRLYDLLKDVYFAGWDLVSGRRIKTSLTILGGIGVGAAAGAGIGIVIGTLVVPGIGSAGGAVAGTVAGALATGLAAVGGPIGLSILGAFGLGWVATKFSKKVYKGEHRFQLSKRVTRKIYNASGVPSDVSELINGYLYNRAKTVENKYYKRAYKNLRRGGIKEADPAVMGLIVKFFCQEIELIRGQLRECDQDDPNKALLETDLRAVQYILSKFNTKKLNISLLQQVDKALKVTLPSEEPKKKRREVEETPLLRASGNERRVTFSSDRASPRQGMRQMNAQPLNKTQLEQMNTQFQREVKDHHLEYIDVKKQETDPNHITYRYKAKGQHKLPKLTFEQEKTASTCTAGLYVDKAKLDDENLNETLELFMAGVRAYCAQAGKRTLTVTVDGDDELAVEFMAALIKEGYKATLDPTEYPPDTAAEKIAEINERAQRKAAEKKPAPRLGVRFRDDAAGG